ncbi:MAG: DUF4102 domain-containing protein [Proteobacteria bacterium]|nr:DUF4102 domain-containing protein [Pseudomonadota bacterium]
MNSLHDTGTTREKTAPMHITKQKVDKLAFPEDKKGNQARYYDDTLKGFGVRLTRNGKIAFFIETAIDGEPTRKTIGRYPAVTVEAARREATRLLGVIASGINPFKLEEANKRKARLGR